MDVKLSDLLGALGSGGPTVLLLYLLWKRILILGSYYEERKASQERAEAEAVEARKQLQAVLQGRDADQRAFAEWARQFGNQAKDGKPLV